MGRKGVLRNYDNDGNLISLECGKCNEIKAVSEFSKCKSKKDGVHTVCKDCIKEYCKQNADKLREYNAEWRKQNAEYYAEYYKQNADKMKEQNTEYRKQNADKIKEYRAEYYKQNADKRKEYKKQYDKQYYKQNKDKIAEYYKQNKDKIAEYRKEYDKERYDSKVEQSLIEIKAYVEIDPQRYDYNPNEEIYGIIYLVHNVKSNRWYVGQTINSFDIRYKCGWLYAHSYKDTVKTDLELYGEDSFEYTKIFKVAHNQRDLDKLEAYYINYYNAYDNGYNETRGNIFTERKLIKKTIDK